MLVECFLLCFDYCAVLCVFFCPPFFPVGVAIYSPHLRVAPVLSFPGFGHRLLATGVPPNLLGLPINFLFCFVKDHSTLCVGFCEGILDNLVRIFRLTCGVVVIIGDYFIKGGIPGVPAGVVEVPVGGLPNGEISFDLDFYMHRKVVAA